MIQSNWKSIKIERFRIIWIIDQITRLPTIERSDNSVPTAEYTNLFENRI